MKYNSKLDKTLECAKLEDAQTVLRFEILFHEDRGTGQ